MQRLYIFKSIKEFLAGHKDQEIKEFSHVILPEDIAACLHLFSEQEQLLILNILGPEAAAGIVRHLDVDGQMRLVRALPDRELADIMASMPSDDRVDLFKGLQKDRGDVILGLIARAKREEIRRLGSYDEGTAGSIMSSEYCSLPADITVQEALNRIRLESPNKETIYTLYIVNEERRLLGVVSLRNLITARPEARVADIMIPDPVFSRVEDDQEDVARKLNKYDLIAMPIVNGDETLVGIVTFDDIQDVMIEEATEDFHNMGAIAHKAAPGLANINMREVSFGTLFQKRLPWLLILVFMNIFSGAGIAYFEETIEAMIALVFFLPLLIDSGGNAGSQAATLMVRALATGKAQMSDWFYLLGREVFVSVALGLSMGLAVSLVGVFRAGPEVAIIVAVTMVCTVLFGSMVGMSLPFLLNKMRLDPATASAPLVTSIADIGGVLIYFTIATYFLRSIIATT